MSISKLRRHKLWVDESVFAALFDPIQPDVKHSPALHTPSDIRYYIDNGQDFKLVCDVKQDSTTPRKHYSWEYQNINEDVLYSHDLHWVYAITIDYKIIKWGESANPLGIKPKQRYFNHKEIQPITGTKSRMGRYRAHGTDRSDTDYRIRRMLEQFVKDPQRKVQFWARKCTEYREVLTLDGYKKTIISSNNKTMEKFFLDFYKSIYGHYPRLNKARA